MISVCIPTYNGENFILEQLLSILKQIGENDEIIISDDSSTDKTINIITSVHDSRIKLFPNNKFKSPIFNLENALKHAKGEYVFIADQDDIWMDNKVNIMMNYLKENDLVVSDCFVIDANKKIIAESFFAINRSRNGFIRNFYKNGYLGCCMAFNKKIVEYVLPFPKNIAMHDIWIGLNAELIGKTIFIKDKLILYRRHGGNFSSAPEKSHYSFLYRFWYRMIFLFLICIRSFQFNVKKIMNKF